MRTTWAAKVNGAGAVRRTRACARWLAAAALAGAVAACAHRPKPRQETLAALDVDLSRPDLAALRREPLIDVHTHTFNARYLPLRELALGKRDAISVAVLLSDVVVKFLVNVIMENTAPFVSACPTLAMIESDARPVLTTERAILKRAAEQAGASPDDALKERAVQALFRALRRTPEGSEAVLRFSSVEADGQLDLPPAADADQDSKALAFLGEWKEPGFLSMLTMPDAQMPDMYRRAHGLQQRPFLIVSHMMDLAPTYDQKPEHGVMLDFAGVQIPNMECVQERPDSHVVYFVAFNPFRDHWPRDVQHGPHDSLDIVRDAIENHHAMGVKVYPPSGYRPFDNRFPDRPRAAVPEPGRQWDARYEGVTNAQLDRSVWAVLDYCVEHDIPVFAHSHTNELEARRGYGLRMADPEFWRRYLISKPKDGRSIDRSKLRLCFGHAGGPDFWFKGGRYEAWGSLVYDLCTRFENVYCEVGILDDIFARDDRARFVERMDELFNGPPPPRISRSPHRGPGTHPAPPPHKPPGTKYAFEGKIMYGTDWFMPISGGARAEYFRAFEQAMLHPLIDTPDHRRYRQFFRGNALRFLDARARLAGASRAPALSNEVRRDFEALVRADDAPTPSTPPPSTPRPEAEPH